MRCDGPRSQKGNQDACQRNQGCHGFYYLELGHELKAIIRNVFKSMGIASGSNVPIC